MRNSHHPADLDFWQEIVPEGTHTLDPPQGFVQGYPARLADGRQLLLPIRERDEGQSALASLIINQASFDVVDAIATELAERLQDQQVQIIVALPTLGLTLAEATARQLGHSRYVALGTSRKFWYDDKLSVPLTSITSPGFPKTLYLDPRLVELLKNKRVCLMDDVISTGSSILSALRLLDRLNITPACMGVAMRQSVVWRKALAENYPGLEERVFAAFDSPRLTPTGNGSWTPESSH